MEDDRQLRVMFAACVDTGRVESGALIEMFAPYGLVRANGECDFPIFSERDALGEAGNALAREIADQVVSQLDIEELVREFGFRDDSQALVIAYHELMWDLVDDLVRTGTVTRPVLLADAPLADKEDVGELVFSLR
jgi:hypothetical protein